MGNISSKKSYKSCYVYIIKSGHGKKVPIKIGIATSPEKRILELQVGNPYLLTLMCKIKMKSRKHAEYIEASLHKLFEHAHMRGEWFRGGKIKIIEAIYQMDRTFEIENTSKQGIHGNKKDEKIKQLTAENNRLRATINANLYK